MSTLTCATCHEPITLLNSQKNGSDVCAPCAIKSAPLLRYVLKRKGEAIVDEVICQAHYQRSLLLNDPLRPQEVEKGYTQTVTPYSGVYGCQECDDEAEQATHAPYERVMGKVG